LAAIKENAPVNYVIYDGGIAIQVGARCFDSQFNLEAQADLDHAVITLVQLGWLKRTSDSQYHLTHAGYAAARKLPAPVGPSSQFLEIKRRMPGLIEEIKSDLEEDSLVREFFVLKHKGLRLGMTSKKRFIYYEDDHENLRGMLDILENCGYLVDVTPGNAPIYRMTEEFVRLVLEG
jgi:hypothetical protein